MSPKVIIIGLDSFSPLLAFDQYKESMPHLLSICENGQYGTLGSTHPPITVPAWVTMTTGRPPSELGIYGFNVREPGGHFRLAQKGDVSYPFVWDIAAKAGLKSVVVSVPLTYPATAHENIFMTTGFMTPSLKSRWASKPSLAKELGQFGDYLIDVTDYRSGDVERIYKDCKALTTQHFDILKYLIKQKDPDFAMLVDIGPDRFHHACLRYIMSTHPRYESSEYGHEYYHFIDSQIGEVLELTDENTVVMVVSDHGIQPLKGSIGINELLIQTGDLVLEQEYPSTPRSLDELKVDWRATKAYARGGYVGRVYVNVEGREPFGCVPRGEVKNEIERLKNVFSSVTLPDGQCVQNRVVDSMSLYGQNAKGMPPDLSVYFGDLSYRAIQTVGHGQLHIESVDNGFDDANHAQQGLFAIKGASIEPSGRGERNIQDIFHLALHHLGCAL